MSLVILVIHVSFICHSGVTHVSFWSLAGIHQTPSADDGGSAGYCADDARRHQQEQGT